MKNSEKALLFASKPAAVTMPKKKIASDATPEKKPKVGTRDVTTLRLEAATLSIDAAGGSLSSFQLGTLNPLSWDSAVHDQLDVSALGPRPLGHFLCLDRWGPPSKEEERASTCFLWGH